MRRMSTPVENWAGSAGRKLSTYEDSEANTSFPLPFRR